jgi:hypothetical protein
MDGLFLPPGAKPAMSEQNPLAGSNVEKLAGCLYNLLLLKFVILPAILLGGFLLLIFVGSSPEAKLDQPTQAPLAKSPARVPDAKPEPPRQLSPEELARHRARMAKLKEQIAKEAEEKAKQDAAQQEKAAVGALKLIKQNMADGKGKGNAKQRLQKLVERFPGTEAAKEAGKLLKDLEQ